MVDAGDTEPTDVLNLLLWRDAQHILGRHAGPDTDNQCGWCGEVWPCTPRRLAERAAAVSRQGLRHPPAVSGMPAPASEDAAPYPGTHSLDGAHGASGVSGANAVVVPRSRRSGSGAHASHARTTGTGDRSPDLSALAGSISTGNAGRFDAARDDNSRH